MAAEQQVWDVTISRREVLRAGSLGSAALAVAPSWASPDSSRSIHSPGHRARSVILLWLEGGASPYETFAPRAGDAENGGLFGSIPSKAGGAPVSALMPRMAGWMDRVMLFRAVHHTEGSHAEAAHRVLTGHVRSASQVYQTMGEVVASGLGSRAVRAGWTGDALSGASCEAAPHLASSQDHFAQSCVVSAPAAGPTRADRRQTLLTGIGGLPALRPAVRNAERSADYGDSLFGRNCRAACRHVEAGAPFVQVTLSGWDCHSELADGYRTLVPQLDQGFAALLGDLDDRGLLRETLVVCMSEFGRSPRFNALGGRDHWPYAGCAVMAGSGLPEGFAIGGVDEDGQPAEGAVSPAKVLLTIYAWLEVPMPPGQSVV